MLCGVLGVLQYRWIGEVSMAARDRLRGSLQANLNRLSLDFSTELAAACRALLPEGSGPANKADETDVAARYVQWKTTSRHSGMFRHIAIAEPRNQTLVLRNLDLNQAVFETVEWPSDWISVKTHLENMMPSQTRQRRGFQLPPEDQGTVFDLPAFRSPTPGGPREFVPGESPSLLFDVNPDYVRDVLLPELLQRHLETGGTLEYQVEVLSRQRPSLVIYQSDPGAQVAAGADASVGLFDTPYDQIFRAFVRTWRTRPWIWTRRSRSRFGTLADVCAPSRRLARGGSGAGPLAQPGGHRRRAPADDGKRRRTHHLHPARPETGRPADGFRRRHLT